MPVDTLLAHHLLPQYRVDCSANFPCPDALRRRIDFWIEVFGSWDRNKAILHDTRSPERIYAVLDTGAGCGRAARKKLNRERNKIKQSLRSVADKLARNKKITTAHERHLLLLFADTAAGKKAGTIRRAVDNIRCQSGVQNGFIKGLQRFHQYKDMVDQVLKDNGLPPEIRYLPFVESSYNPAAYSKVGAAGMWQIMPKTARSLGLELNATLDERLDPEAATRAAARYFLRSTEVLNSVSRKIQPRLSQSDINPFIITSYNYGVNGMSRAIRQIGPDFVKVLDTYKSPNFRIAVKNFYASFLAASYLAANSKRYFGSVVLADQPRYQVTTLQHDTSIARIKQVFGLHESDLKPINRELTRFIWNGWRMLPAGYRLKLPSSRQNWQPELNRLARLAPEKQIPGLDRYRVRKGDTACGIARALGVNCSTLIKVNRLNKRATIRIGQNLTIPRRVTGQSGAAGLAGQTYRVKRGDTACRIAERFAVSCLQLIKVNNLGSKAKIVIGQTLTMPRNALSNRGDSLNANNQYVVRKGDSACHIARRYAVSCAELKSLNRLNRAALIFPGQKLLIPGLQLPDTTQTASRLAQGGTAGAAAAAGQTDVQSDRAQPLDGDVAALSNLLDTLPNLEINITSRGDQPIYFMHVETDETLSHYADWLGLRSIRQLLRLNKLNSSRALPIGKRLVLPIDNARQVSEFEQKRTEYHQILSESLKENYALAGIESYRVKSGDSIWSMSNRLGFPLWLIYRLNPNLRSASLAAGQVIKLPRLVRKNN